MDLIIGSGITGLCYAMFTNNAYRIVEKEKEIGGYCRTTKRNGFVWDYSGHFFHFQDPEIMESIMSNIEDPDSIANVTKNTSIKYKTKLVDYPFQKNIHQLPQEEFIDCLVDLFSIDSKAGFQNFKEMLYCKFGKSIADKFLIPYNEKLYACNLNNLDKDAMGRFFPYADKEQIILNFRKGKAASYNDTFMYPRGGAIEYVNAVLKGVDSNVIQKETSIKSIDIQNKKAVLSSGEEMEYDNLISTIPFPKLLEIAHIDYDRNIYSWNKVLVFNLGFDKKGPNTTSHWLYFPEKKYSFYRVGFYDNILGQDRTSLYVELGFSKDEEIIPEQWKDKVLDDLVDAGCISSDDKLIDSETIIMDPAYVHITESSKKNVQCLKEDLENFGVYSIGRYGSWTYCSIEDNIKEAKALATKLNTNI